MENKKVTYSYSAIENEEIKRIRDKYIQPSSVEKNKKAKLNELRKLDKIPHNRGTIISVFIGIMGCLVFGLGMSCITVWSDNHFWKGIFIGVAGLALIASALPVYQYAVARTRKRLAPRIIRMSEELLDQ